MFTSRAEYRILLRQDDADMRLTPKGYEIGLASRERYDLMCRKKELRDGLIDFARNFAVRSSIINPSLEAIGETPLRQGCKLYDLILRPQLGFEKLIPLIEPLQRYIESIDPELRGEVVECAEILIKYKGYIEREQLVADRIRRLEDIRLDGKLDYSTITALSTEARQKLTRINPTTIAQASRIPGISPSDINILLVLLGR